MEQRVLFAGHQNQVIQQPSMPMPFETIELKEGEPLFRDGDAPKGLYFVQSGCVKMVVHRELTRGRTTTPEYVTKLVSPGEFFGYKAMVRGSAHRGTATALKDSVVHVYPRESVIFAMRSANPLLMSMLEQAVSDLDSYERISQLHYLASVQERVAYQLVTLAEKFGVKTEKGVVLNLRLTRNEFAQLASTINESLSRHLTELKNAGILDVDGKEILIKDLAALKAKSGNFR